MSLSTTISIRDRKKKPNCRLFSRGVWKSRSSDNGAEFRNSLMQKIAETLGVDNRYSIPFHARSRGAVENTVKTTMQVLRKFVNYSYNDWSDFLPVTQLAINYKIRLKTASSAFSLMFARKLNDLKDYKTKDKHGNFKTLSHAELEERIVKMASIVFPAINERTQKILELQKAKFDKKNRLIDIDIDIGAAVMIKLEKRPHKLAPIYSGPYIVVRKTQANAYVLKDEDGDLLHRDYVPSELKVVSIDESQIEEQTYEIEEIRDHRGPPHKREYLVKWKGLGTHMNTWEPVTSFTNPQLVIGKYWDKINKEKEQRALRTTKKPETTTMVVKRKNINLDKASPAPEDDHNLRRSKRLRN